MVNIYNNDFSDDRFAKRQRTANRLLRIVHGLSRHFSNVAILRRPVSKDIAVIY